MVRFLHSKGPEIRTPIPQLPDKLNRRRSKGHAKAGTVSHPRGEESSPIFLVYDRYRCECEFVVPFCTCASICSLSGAEGSRQIIFCGLIL